MARLTHAVAAMRAMSAAISLAAILVAGAPAAGAEGDVVNGKALAQANCARCHAVGFTGDSPNPKAPPFRTLSERFPVDTIDEALLTKATPAHTDMPHFAITIKQARDIAAYIATVQPVAHGRQLVEYNCSPCHATGRTGESPHPDAPPFRVLGQRYPIDALEEAFAEGIETGHPDMPSFVAEPDQIADMLAYISSIQVEPIK